MIQVEFIDMDTSIEKARQVLQEADAIIIGASNGLSISEGYNIFADNEMFRQQFGDFRERFGLRNVLDGIFSENMDAETRQEFLTRLVKLWIEDYKPSEPMKNLYSLVRNKPYFILTTNADEHLEASGFDPEKVWEIEGTFRTTLKNEPPVNRNESFNQFFSEFYGKRIVVLELGIGSRNRIIKLPLMQLVYGQPKATYITLNLPHEIYIPEEITDKSIALSGDISKTLSILNNSELH